jgi:undecaprenyl-phosphate 4-deoxy-4-formamido-L-arabinose transferase
VVIAKYNVKRQSAFKNFGSWVNDIMSQWLLEKPKDLRFENFSVMKRFIVDEILRYQNAYLYIEGLLLRTTSDIINIVAEERERALGQGSFTIKKSLHLKANGLTSLSTSKQTAQCTGYGFITLSKSYFSVCPALAHVKDSSGFTALYDASSICSRRTKYHKRGKPQRHPL